MAAIGNVELSLDSGMDSGNRHASREAVQN